MLKDTKINEGTVYLGRGAGREIYDKIKSARSSIKVITPYIHSDYVELLKNKALNGLDVKLVVSSDVGGNKKDKYKSLRKLISQKKHINYALQIKRKKQINILNIALIILCIITIIGLYYQSQYTWWLALIFPIVFIVRKRVLSLTIFTYTYFSELGLSIAMSPYIDGFNKDYTLIHAKLFIIDDVAYIGSINFTKAAFWYNYESRIKFTKSNIVADLAQEFEYVYNNENTVYLNIQSMGKRLYSEPPN